MIVFLDLKADYTEAIVSGQDWNASLTWIFWSSFIHFFCALCGWDFIAHELGCLWIVNDINPLSDLRNQKEKMEGKLWQFTIKIKWPLSYHIPRLPNSHMLIIQTMKIPSHYTFTWNHTARIFVITFHTYRVYNINRVSSHNQQHSLTFKLKYNHTDKEHED